VRDLGEARAFYGDLLGCPEGRSSKDWVDFDFFGHQIVAHLSANDAPDKEHNVVDGENVPVRHFGAILPMDDWRNLAARLQERNVSFIIEPGIRFEGLPGEQATFFFLDPSGNALEFKAFHDEGRIFAR
jgi:extradiol dioxygenase family protein